VHVYPGTDPVTGKPRLTRTVRTEVRAAQELAKLILTVDVGRAPDDSGTLGFALDGYLEVADLGVTTRHTRESYIRRIIGPVLADVRLRSLGSDTIDALYAHLRRCSRLCGRLPKTGHHAEGEHACDERCSPLRDHRTADPHECDQRCRPHCAARASLDRARPRDHLGGAEPRGTSGSTATRAERARLPRMRRREPQPPSPEEAARLKVVRKRAKPLPARRSLSHLLPTWCRRWTAPGTGMFFQFHPPEWQDRGARPHLRACL
jgi:hypothetical protein